ncbi:MAG: hypothetical protein UZ11_BCD004001060 [Bacteroidetes bacterium OLB11]|nr:MAG: hypothetical protein UZ11_BCD004001060 [Bacteroidetes bacterium OLB11]
MNGLGQIDATTDGVAYWAHIGGFVYGAIIGGVIRYRVSISDFVLE